MDHHAHRHTVHIAEAADALAETGAHPPERVSADDMVLAMCDLATIAGLVGQLAARTRRQLAAWTTVGAHLQQAEQHATDLRRCLNHACATFAFTSSPPTAA